MKRIISVSRRTDIPAFFGDWFMNRLKDGFVGYINPFGGQKYIVSLKPDDVICFVFWSKNYVPFTEKLKAISDMGYKFYLHYTITNLPKPFEPNVPDKKITVDNLKLLSKLFSPKHISWRYDPIVISDVTDEKFHIKNFYRLAKELEGYVERCYFHYVTRYEKVKRNIYFFQNQHGLKVANPNDDTKVKLANALADIAKESGIKMFSCCGDYLVGEKIEKAHCVDGAIIEELFNIKFNYKEKPSRVGCGCTQSTDIGAYDTCPHGCVYCYANVNKKTAYLRFKAHDKESAFLGYSKAESDRWIKEIKEKETASLKQIELF